MRSLDEGNLPPVKRYKKSWQMRLSKEEDLKKEEEVKKKQESVTEKTTPTISAAPIDPALDGQDGLKGSDSKPDIITESNNLVKTAPEDCETKIEAEEPTTANSTHTLSVLNEAPMEIDSPKEAKQQAIDKKAKPGDATESMTTHQVPPSTTVQEPAPVTDETPHAVKTGDEKEHLSQTFESLEEENARTSPSDIVVQTKAADADLQSSKQAHSTQDEKQGNQDEIGKISEPQEAPMNDDHRDSARSLTPGDTVPDVTISKSQVTSATVNETLQQHQVIPAKPKSPPLTPSPSLAKKKPFELPLTLRIWLQQDKERIMHPNDPVQHRLPAKITARQVLEQAIPDQTLRQEWIDLFNDSISVLLYAPESKHMHTPAVDYFGPTHLVRLLYMLPTCPDLLVYLQEHATKWSSTKFYCKSS